MKAAFMCSLCRGGILGGGLYLDDEAVTYCTQKSSVPERYKKLVLPLKEMEKVTWKRIVFPVATFHMKDGEQYKIIIYNKKRFDSLFQMQNVGR